MNEEHGTSIKTSEPWHILCVAVVAMNTLVEGFAIESVPLPLDMKVGLSYARVNGKLHDSMKYFILYSANNMGVLQ